MSPSPGLPERVEAMLGSEPVEWRRVRGGYTHAERWLIRCANGQTAFVKAATADDNAGWLRTEEQAYRALEGHPFLAKQLAWDDDGALPAMILEDLSAAQWPPPWDRGSIDRVLETLGQIAASAAPECARRVDQGSDGRWIGWQRIAAQPGPFLALGMCSAAWLQGALPALIAHEQEGAAAVAGDALLHHDVRSDNICFAGRRTIFVDWNFIAKGDALFDVAAWLPSLEFEGGPAPEEVSEEAGIFAGVLSGYFGSMAGLPLIPHAPRVRLVQRQQLSRSLPWVVRVLGLPPLDLG